jgi:uncharacterized protein
MFEDINFTVSGDNLVGTFCQAPNERAAALIVAGGGNKSRSQSYQTEWQKIFLESGITTFSFDFRGVGESDRVLGDTSIETRIADTKAALSVLKGSTSTKKFIIGTSMGGPVSIQSADETISGLLLNAPAAYSLESRNMNFGPDFSEAIRKVGNWKDSPDFTDLRGFEEKTFLMYGTEDEVIPKEILQNYKSIVQANQGRVIELNTETHNSWKNNDFALRQMISFMVET